MDTKPPPRHLSARGLALLKSFESGPAGDFAPEPYLSPAGPRQIGWGHRILRHESFALPISRDMAHRILLEDLRNPEAYVSAIAVRTPFLQCEFDALVMFAFDLGVGALERSALLRIIRRPTPGECGLHAEWMRGNTADLDPGPAHQLRRACELMLFRGDSDAAIAAHRARAAGDAQTPQL